jgi:prepilin-type N-terminal cleavage/methylation domain-containing protein
MLGMMGMNSTMPVSGRRPRQERGFTLYEIMVVVVIVGLVVAVGFPMMTRSVVRARILSQVGVLKQAVAMARIRALKQGGGVAVRFLTTNAAQEGGEVIAWVDSNGDGFYGPPTEILVGRWPVKNKVILKPDPGNLLHKLGWCRTTTRTRSGCWSLAEREPWFRRCGTPRAACGPKR